VDGVEAGGAGSVGTATVVVLPLPVEAAAGELDAKELEARELGDGLKLLKLVEVAAAGEAGSEVTMGGEAGVALRPRL
jgi:hypothetical protein